MIWNVMILFLLNYNSLTHRVIVLGQKKKHHKVDKKGYTEFVSFYLIYERKFDAYQQIINT